MTATTLDGQLELFDMEAPAPPLTVYTCVWTSSQRCGWCNAPGYHGGGACRNPKNDKESFFYSYCKRCYDHHGGPKFSQPDFAVNIVRTVTPRPGESA